MPGTTLSGMRAARVLAGLTLRRLWRSKLIWLSAFFILVPPMVLVMVGGDDEFKLSEWSSTYRPLNMLLAILPALHMAPAIAEEIEDRTFTYLWSRPFPRWALLAGKLMALVPVLVLLLGVAITAVFLLMYGELGGEHGVLLGHGLGAMLAGVLAASATTMGIGALLHRYATASAIVYLLIIDTAVGEMPFALHNLSVNYHVRQIALAPLESMAEPGVSLIWLASMSALWIALAIWRITVSEYATDK